MLANLKNEVSNMRLLVHPNIVQLYDVKKSPNNLYLIVEYCNYGSLEQYLGQNKNILSERESIKIMKEMVDGFKCLYSKNIVHRDLKPANILMHDGISKIADFGFSKLVDHGMEEKQIVTQVGSPLYMSP